MCHIASSCMSYTHVYLATRAVREQDQQPAEKWSGLGRTSQSGNAASATKGMASFFSPRMPRPQRPFTSMLFNSIFLRVIPLNPCRQHYAHSTEKCLHIYTLTICDTLLHHIHFLLFMALGGSIVDFTLD